MSLILVLLVILLLFGAGGGIWGYRSGYYGAYPLGGIGLVLFVIVLIILFSGRTWF